MFYLFLHTHTFLDRVSDYYCTLYSSHALERSWNSYSRLASHFIQRSIVRFNHFFPGATVNWDEIEISLALPIIDRRAKGELAFN